LGPWNNIRWNDNDFLIGEDLRKIFSIVLALSVSGCVITGPTRLERIAVADLEYMDGISAVIEVEDKTGIANHDFDYIDIKKTIENEVIRQNKRGNELSQKSKLKFTYLKCETTGHFPSDSNQLNMVIRIFSFGIVATGDIKKCPSLLEIQDPTTGATTSKYETSVENKQGGSIFEYLGNLSEVRKENRVLIPMKKLLLDYQGVIKK
tara:strand:- start:43845 stop:44465 length:621 start_codon:yes stop_codon:yes gene_type:complete